MKIWTQKFVVHVLTIFSKNNIQWEKFKCNTVDFPNGSSTKPKVKNNFHQLHSQIIYSNNSQIEILIILYLHCKAKHVCPKLLNCLPFAYQKVQIWGGREKTYFLFASSQISDDLSEWECEVFRARICHGWVFAHE